MVAYEGVATESEYAEIQQLWRQLSSAILLLMFAESKHGVLGPDERYSGRLSDQMLEARIAGVDARIPWRAVIAHAASPSVMVLAIGQLCLPIARSFFPGEEQWQLARATIEKHVPLVPGARRTAILWWTVVLWLALLVVIFLAWHFAQIQKAP